MKKIKVMLVEDDPFWQETLSADLSEEADVEVVGIAATKDEVVRMAASESVDVVLMDINLTDNHLDGLEATRELMLAGRQDIKIIMLTSLQEKNIIIRSFQNGAVNFISKANYKDILQAIRDAHAGKMSLHADSAPILVKEIQLSQLTPSEREIYELREQGLSRSEMSRLLHKSVNTIKTQLRSIRDKLIFGKKDS